MGLAGIKLSAIPAVTLVIAVGIGMEFVVHVCVVSIDVFSRNFFYQMQENHSVEYRLCNPIKIDINITIFYQA